MTIRRENSADFLNRIANDPAVRPFVDYRDTDEPMDFAPLANLRIAQSGCVTLSNGEDAFAIFEMTGSDEFQSHTFFGPTCRGRRAVDTGKEMVAHMFESGAKRLWGATPMNNRGARWFNRQIGAKVTGHDEYEAEGPVELFEITRG